MNKKGFTVLELIVSFVLAAVIGFYLLQVDFVFKDLYTDNYVKSLIINDQAIMTERLYDDLLQKDIRVSLICGKNCIRFIFSDYSEKILKIENSDTFNWGDFTLKLSNNSKFEDVNVTTRDIEDSDSLMRIDIPVNNSIFTDSDFDVRIIVPYNNSISSFTDTVFSSDSYDYYMGLNSGKSYVLDSESVFTDPGVHVYYGEDTCSMVSTVNYQNIKTSPRIVTNSFGSNPSVCSNLKVSVDYTNLRATGKKYNLGEYDVSYKLYVNNVFESEVKRHIFVIDRITRFPYSGNVQTFRARVSGYYKLEVWGAQGVNTQYGFGAYASATLGLYSGEELYVYVGQSNDSRLGVPNYNSVTGTFDGYSGGGATDIRTVSGAWNSNKNSRIIIAGGGGSGASLGENYGHGNVSGSTYGDSGLSNKATSKCGPGGGYTVQGFVSCSDAASGGTSYVATNFVLNGRTVELTEPLIIAGNKANIMNNPYTGLKLPYGNIGDGYAIITYLGN